MHGHLCNAVQIPAVTDAVLQFVATELLQCFPEKVMALCEDFPLLSKFLSFPHVELPWP